MGGKPSSLGSFKDHWLEGVRHIPSPNCDDRQSLEDISLIIVHGISLPPGEFGGPHVEELFTNKLDPNAHPYFNQIRELRVSSHFFIRRDGVVEQYVPVSKRAWHAGVSNFNGRERCNDFSIGIELEGTDEGPYEVLQYNQLNTLIAKLLAAYPTLSSQRICGHSDVAPGRKTDPGPFFEWNRVHRS